MGETNTISLEGPSAFLVNPPLEIEPDSLSHSSLTPEKLGREEE